MEYMIFIDSLDSRGKTLDRMHFKAKRGAASKKNLVMFETRVNFEGSKQFCQSLGRINSKKPFTPWLSMRPIYLSQTRIAKPLSRNPTSCLTKALMWGP